MQEETGLPMILCGLGRIVPNCLASLAAPFCPQEGVGFQGVIWIIKGREGKGRERMNAAGGTTPFLPRRRLQCLWICFHYSLDSSASNPASSKTGTPRLLALLNLLPASSPATT